MNSQFARAPEDRIESSARVVLTVFLSGVLVAALVVGGRDLAFQARSAPGNPPSSSPHP